MNKKYSLLPFTVVALVYFASLALKNDMVQLITKPLLMIGLIVYFLLNTADKASGLKKWALMALLFSCLGDTLLMFANKNELYFILGLAAFLIAHVFYIITFHSIKKKEHIEGKWQFGIIVAIYYFFILSVLMPYLQDMKWPVIVYGFVISCMLFLAMLLYDMQDNRTARYLLTGAVFFIISDSVLAINKFYLSFSGAAWIIMITYVLAQWLITEGLVRYINSK